MAMNICKTNIKLCFKVKANKQQARLATVLLLHIAPPLHFASRSLVPLFSILPLLSSPNTFLPPLYSSVRKSNVEIDIQICMQQIFNSS